MPETDGHQRKRISVGEFLRNAPADIALEVIAGERGLDSQFIDSHRTQKLGLAFAGYRKYLHSGRIKMLGQSELDYLHHLSPEALSAAIGSLEPNSLTCIIIVKSLDPPRELIDFSESNHIPVLRSPLLSSRAIVLVTDHLLASLAPSTSVHGVLLEMYGLGVMIIGTSGIGKSECALDLVMKGHRLVADDAVVVKRIGDELIGSSPQLTFEHLEIRGLGIINIRELFGVASVCETIRLDLCIEFRKWVEIDQIERIGLEMRSHDIFGIEIAKFLLPVSSGRNLATLVETAVRVYMLRCAGIDPAARLVEKHLAMVATKPEDGEV
jgi:HPr kinase/phosphorylase